MANRSDNFNRANNASAIGSPSDGGGTWTTANGTFGITANTFYRSVGAGYGFAWLDAAATAGTVSGLYSAAGGSGLIARVIDANNLFYLELNGGSIGLYKRLAGTFTQVGSTYWGGYNVGDSISLTVDSAGNWTAKRNATTIITGTDNAHSSATSWGIGVTTNGAQWDDLSFADPAVGSGAALAGNVDLGSVVPGGGFGSSASDLSGGVTLSDVVAAGTLGSALAAWSVPALTNWSGTLQASVTIPVVTFQRLSDGVQVLVLTSQTTNGAGTLSGTSGSLSAGITYMVCGWNADGSQRFAVPVTAT